MFLMRRWDRHLTTSQTGPTPGGCSEYIALYWGALKGIGFPREICVERIPPQTDHVSVVRIEVFEPFCHAKDRNATVLLISQITGTVRLDHKSPALPRRRPLKLKWRSSSMPGVAFFQTGSLDDLFESIFIFSHLSVFRCVFALGQVAALIV